MDDQSNQSIKVFKVVQVVKITSGSINGNKCNYELSRGMPGKEIGNKEFVRRWWKKTRDAAEVMLSGRLFQMVGQAQDREKFAGDIDLRSTAVPRNQRKMNSSSISA